MDGTVIPIGAANQIGRSRCCLAEIGPTRDNLGTCPRFYGKCCRITVQRCFCSDYRNIQIIIVISCCLDECEATRSGPATAGLRATE
jgi:hypothetical protein